MGGLSELSGKSNKRSSMMVVAWRPRKLAPPFINCNSKGSPFLSSCSTCLYNLQDDETCKSWLLDWREEASYITSESDSLKVCVSHTSKYSL